MLASISNEITRRLKGIKGKVTDAASTSPKSIAVPTRTVDSVPSSSKKEEEAEVQLLTGKLKTTSTLDLVELEIASLQVWDALLERENKLLERLEAVESSVENEDVLNELTECHQQLRSVHDSFQAERKQAAVDTVEFVFRSLQTRLPSRMRSESEALARTRALQANVQSSHALPSVSAAGGKRDQITAMRNSVVMLGNARAVARTPSYGGNPAETVALIDRTLSKMGAPVETYSVLKVNRFRKNSPHLLELDSRTSSLVVKDAVSRAPKVELTSFNATEFVASAKAEEDLLIKYTMYQNQGPVHVEKKYRFNSAKELNDFVTSAKSLLAGKKKAKTTAAKKHVEDSSTRYTPKPLQVSNIPIPADLTDFIDGLATNLARRWNNSRHKAIYKVDDAREKTNDTATLRDKLRLFANQMSPTASKYRNVSYIIAEAMVQTTLSLEYSIRTPSDETSPIEGEELRTLVHDIARNCHEVWSEIAQRHDKLRHEEAQAKSRHARRSPRQTISTTTNVSRSGRAGDELSTTSASTHISGAMSMPVHSSDSALQRSSPDLNEDDTTTTTLPPVPSRTSSEYKTAHSRTMSSRSIAGNEDEESTNDPTRATTSSPRFVPIRLVSFADLTESQQNAMIADVEEFIRALAEYDKIVVARKRPVPVVLEEG